MSLRQELFIFSHFTSNCAELNYFFHKVLLNFILLKTNCTISDLWLHLFPSWKTFKVLKKPFPCIALSVQLVRILQCYISFSFLELVLWDNHRKNIHRTQFFNLHDFLYLDFEPVCSTFIKYSALYQEKMFNISRKIKIVFKFRNKSYTAIRSFSSSEHFVILFIPFPNRCHIKNKLSYVKTSKNRESFCKSAIINFAKQ